MSFKNYMVLNICSESFKILVQILKARILMTLFSCFSLTILP